jgi:hypothetical protein
MAAAYVLQEPWRDLSVFGPITRGDAEASHLELAP